jgi:hypothetical protein
LTKNINAKCSGTFHSDMDKECDGVEKLTDVMQQTSGPDTFSSDVFERCTAADKWS